MKAERLHMHALASYKKNFDRTLAAFFNTRLKVYRGLGKGTLVPQFIEQSRVIALSGGKRLRPYLATLAYKTYGGKVGAAIKEVALGLEIFHLFALAHDDIVDKGLRRHGASTSHEFATELLLHHKRLGDVRHVGQGQGMLAGDLLLLWAQELFVGNGLTSKKRLLALNAFRQTADELFVGEMIDIDLTTQHSASLADIDRKNILKTARYTFVGPLRIGARLATGGLQHDTFLERFGESLGLAFQMQDDLLDVVGGDTGKEVLADIAARQHTYLTYYMLHKASPLYKKRFERVFGKEVNREDFQKIKSLYVESGAVDFARGQVSRQFANARKYLHASSVPAHVRPEWESLVDTIYNRTS